MPALQMTDKCLLLLVTTSSKASVIPPRRSASLRELVMRIASLWQSLSRCSTSLCRVMVLHGTSIHTALPSGARLGLQLISLQRLHHIPGSPDSQTDVSSHGKSFLHEGLTPVLRCFEALGFTPVLTPSKGAALVSVEFSWLTEAEVEVDGPLK